MPLPIAEAGGRTQCQRSHRPLASQSRAEQEGGASDVKSFKISVVVTACGDSGPLRELLGRVRRQAGPLDAELVLAINRPAEDFETASLDTLAELTDRIVHEPEPGKSNALNTAIPACRGELVAFTDDDASPDDGWLEQITAPLRQDSGLAGTGGPVLPIFPTGGPPAWYRQILARSRTNFLGPYHFLGNEARDYRIPSGLDPLPLGANACYRRENLLEHPFLPELGPNYTTQTRGGEDTLLALELLMAGRRLRYVPTARVYHPVSPERMTVEYVRGGFQIQGMECIRILRAIGRPLPTVGKLKRSIDKHELNWFKRTIYGEDRTLRRSLRGEFLKRVLEERTTS